MITVCPISITQVDWKVYLNAAKTIADNDVARPLDAKNIPLKGAKAYLQTLAILLGREIKSELLPLRHISLTLLVTLPLKELCVLLSKTDLLVDLSDTDEELSIISGNLQQWRDLCLNLNDTSNQIQREFINKVIHVLDTFHFNFLWAGYNRKPYNDGTYLLE